MIDSKSFIRYAPCLGIFTTEYRKAWLSEGWTEVTSSS